MGYGTRKGCSEPPTYPVPTFVWRVSVAIREARQNLPHFLRKNVVAALLIAFSGDQARGAAGQVLKPVTHHASQPEPFFFDGVAADQFAASLLQFQFAQGRFDGILGDACTLQIPPATRWLINLM